MNNASAIRAELRAMLRELDDMRADFVRFAQERANGDRLIETLGVAYADAKLAPMYARCRALLAKSEQQ